MIKIKYLLIFLFAVSFCSSVNAATSTDELILDTIGNNLSLDEMRASTSAIVTKTGKATTTQKIELKSTSTLKIKATSTIGTSTLIRTKSTSTGSTANLSPDNTKDEVISALYSGVNPISLDIASSSVAENSTNSQDIPLTTVEKSSEIPAQNDIQVSSSVQNINNFWGIALLNRLLSNFLIRALIALVIIFSIAALIFYILARKLDKKIKLSNENSDSDLS
ncbi:MAG: hypothetical protein WCG01_05500 [bacterium]